MSYITEQEALDNVTEFASQTASDKARLLAQSEAYLRARNVKEYKDGANVPQALKLACYEVIRGVLSNDLYQGQSQTDGNWRKPCWRTLVGSAQDDD